MPTDPSLSWATYKIPVGDVVRFIYRGIRCGSVSRYYLYLLYTHFITFIITHQLRVPPKEGIYIPFFIDVYIYIIYVYMS